jgi:hypothetical protein
VLGTLKNLGLDKAISSRRCRERDIIVALIVERLIHPGSNPTPFQKLSMFVCNTCFTALAELHKRPGYKPGANYGWLSELNDMEHLTMHIRGIPHEH